ncbi:O-antigen ligase family protein [Mycobacterium sp. CVI_P3]|uniref:O-antigen ligase family protein n=1 Tax=Mycobacterium pinniadriaticum TaxID=2994102 RepID=A0ABT3SIC1_9MYCO|nr:O-antigen ligase family protein [Mycobacterium pinniadriaticum]MCX2932693.1 O-antigen ligase family protein [Mycobacterium pinniadriaticum]MCX2939117.1 O-antigen ligase family protein [Mycobacterium pinniadriaticum]
MTDPPRARSRELAMLVVVGGIAEFGALTMLGSRSPLLLVLAPIGMIALVVAARRPLLALSIMVVVEFTNLSGLVGARSGLPIFPASLMLGVLAVALALRDPHARGRLNSWTVLCCGFLAVFLATQLVATIGSVDPGASFAGMYRLTVDCVFIVVVLALVQITGRPWTVATVIVVTLAAISALTVIDEVFFGGTASFGGLSTVTTASGEGITTLRYGGPLPDSNFWGRHLVMGLPMSAALLTRALRFRRPPAIAAWVAVLLILLAGTYLTQSRGTFLAAGAAILVWFAAAERPVRRWSLLMLPAGLAVFLVPGIGNRLVAALDDVLRAKEHSNVDPSVLGRLAAQQEAWAMFGERPVFGFGPATFPEQVIQFAGRVAIAVREPTNAPHNLYAELAAESGVVGLLGWAVVVIGFIMVAVLGVMACPHPRDRILAAAVCAAIVAWSVGSIGLHLAYFRTFGVVLALAAGVVPIWPVPAEPLRRLARGVIAWSAAGLVGTTASLGCLWATGSMVVTASQAVTLVPAGPIDGWYSYALDVRSRIEQLYTFAILLEETGSNVQVVADPVRGVLTFSAMAETPDQARDEIQVAVAHADSALHGAIGYQQYYLYNVGSMTITRSRVDTAPAFVGALGVGAATVIVTGVLLLRAQTRWRIHGLVGRPATQESPSVPSLNR